MLSSSLLGLPSHDASSTGRLRTENDRPDGRPGSGRVEGTERARTTARASDSTMEHWDTGARMLGCRSVTIARLRLLEARHVVQTSV